MRVIVHLSDIHFGRVDTRLIAPLVETVPLHNPFTRFLQPLDKYRRFITDDLQPFYFDDEIAVVGISTARSLTIKGGRVNKSQIEWMRSKLCALEDEITKIVVTHHPFDLPEGYNEGDLVGRSRLAMETLANCGADLFLAGPLHVSHTSHTAKRYKIHGHSALVVQAGTATSTRGRGEANSFNVIRIAHPQITVDRLEWQPESAGFFVASTESFRQTAGGWVRE